MTSIFIFRRDLRTYDNNALRRAFAESDKVLPCFIFDPNQVGNQNSFRSNNAIQFMIESLEDLNIDLHKKSGKLFVFHGEPHKIVKKIAKAEDATAVYVNMDVSPYSRTRDKKIAKVCDSLGIDFISETDVTMYPMDEIRTQSGGVYKKFTPFFNTAKKIPVPKPKATGVATNKMYSTKKLPGEIGLAKARAKFMKFNKEILHHGGRKNAMERLVGIKKYKNYNKTRNCLDKRTTELSAYIKFGCLSIREVYWTFRNKLGMTNDLIKQLYWREFYSGILYHFPYVLGGSFKKEYDKLKWGNNAGWFKKWKEGMTGFPIVDAGMRQMNTVGFMHNRCRMIVSNFLIKDLHIDWRKGEKYFSNMLYDIDVANNNSGWQWSSSTGTDSQPYFRIFNPWTQSSKFDPDCEYIKKWIPELKDVPDDHIHKWYKYYEDHDVNYPAPMVDHDAERKKTLKAYKRALN